MSAAFFTVCERLLGAAANGVYQGVLVTALAALALRLFARTNAATRHAVWFGVLLLVAAFIPAHLLVSSLSRPDPPAATGRTAAATADALQPSDPAGDRASWPEPGPARLSPPRNDLDADGPEGPPNAPAFGLRGDRAGREGDPNGQPRETAVEKPWWKLTPALLQVPPRRIETAVRLPRWISVCAVSAWVLLAAIRGGLLACGLRGIRRAKTTATAPGPALQALFNRLRDSLAVRRQVRLGLSGAHRTALLLGFSHPVVLLPAEMDQEAAEGRVEHVLRHELAHLDRRDDWANLAQQALQAALFFPPAVWWISTRLSLEREICCDDHVLAAAGRPREYALTLASLAERLRPGRQPLSPGVTANHSQLQQRIVMILNTQRDRSPRLTRSRLGIFATTAAMLAALAIGAAPRLVVAQPKPDAPPAAPVPEGTPAALPPDATVESGPRSKPGRGGSSLPVSVGAASVAPEVSATPPPPSLSVASVAPALELPEPPAAPLSPPVAPAPPAPDMRPVPTTPPAPRGRKRDVSIEERLNRIERMVEELQAHRGVTVHARNSEGIEANINADIAAKVDVDNARMAADMSRRAAEAGRRAAESAQRETERALRDMAKFKSKDFERMQEDMAAVESEAPQKALQALRSAHESLGQQMQPLERQIQRLEREQNRMKKPDGKGRSDDSDDAPKPRPPSAEPK